MSEPRTTDADMFGEPVEPVPVDQVEMEAYLLQAKSRTTIEEKAAILRLRAACAGLSAKQIERLIADFLKGKSA